MAPAFSTSENNAEAAHRQKRCAVETVFRLVGGDAYIAPLRQLPNS